MALLIFRMDLNDLVRRCIKGDSRSQKELYNLLKGRLMGVCLRFNPNQDEANDIFQEAMIRVFKNIKKARKVDSVIAWATRITSNVAIDMYRRKRAAVMVSLDDSQVAEFTSKELDAIRRLELEELLGLIQMLPPNYRIVFNLYLIDGYSHKEIASRLEIAESTSRALLTRAKRRMIELLKKTEPMSHVYG